MDHLMARYTFTTQRGTEYRARTLLALARKVEHSRKATLHTDGYNQGTSNPLRRYFSLTPSSAGGYDVGCFLGVYDSDEINAELVAAGEMEAQ